MVYRSSLAVKVAAQMGKESHLRRKLMGTHPVLLSRLGWAAPESVCVVVVSISGPRELATGLPILKKLYI